jgi:cystathionine gamma-synthase
VEEICNAKKLIGTIISFDLLEGAEFADSVCRNVKLIRHATSLGAVESTMERRFDGRPY